MTEQAERSEHFCTGCGELHGGEQRVSPEVEIARIMAARDVKIAQLEYREAQEADELAAETAVAVTELETASAVAAEEAAAEAGPPEPEPEPEPVVTQDVAEPEPEPDLAPPEAEHHREPPAAKSRGFWPGA